MNADRQSSIENRRSVTFSRAALVSAALSLLFLVVYGTTNHLAGLRSDVGAWAYEWERRIPFVPLMIVPYMSIDLFFVAAPFLCRDRRELSILSRRIVLAILVAGAFFLIMPLRFSFERPPVSGALGAVFDWFRSMDQPYNEFPSLHIALRTILADLYARRLAGWKRFASDVWFSLIGFSTLLTYQHHVADVAGGFLLAGLCFYLIGEAPWRQAMPADTNGGTGVSPVRGSIRMEHPRRRDLPGSWNPRVGVRYVAAAAILVAIASLAWPWAAILLWPALSFLIVGAAYFGLGPGVFRKHQGRLPFAARLLLWPVVFGHDLSRRRYAKRSNPWDAIAERVWIGRTLDHDEAERALAAGVTAILDLTSELPAPEPFARHAAYRNLPVLDLTAPSVAMLREAVEFIRMHAGDEDDRRGAVYVHCKAGYSRSAAVAGAYLLESGLAADADEAIAMLKAARPGIIIRPEAAAAIRTFRCHDPRAGEMHSD